MRISAITENALKLMVLALIILSLFLPDRDEKRVQSVLHVLYSAGGVFDGNDRQDIFHGHLDRVTDNLPDEVTVDMIPFNGGSLLSGSPFGEEPVLERGDSLDSAGGANNLTVSPPVDLFTALHVLSVIYEAKGDAVATGAANPVLLYTNGLLPVEISQFIMTECHFGTPPPFFVYPVAEGSPGVSVLALSSPARTTSDRPFPVEVVLWSDEERECDLAFSCNGVKEVHQDVPIRRGINAIPCEVGVSGKGLIDFTAGITSENDTYIFDNHGYGWTRIAGRPKLLYITEEDDIERYFLRRLKNLDWDIRIAVPRPYGSFRHSLDGYSLVIVNDTGAYHLSRRFQRDLERGVRERGMGLCMIGGTGGFGPGGYFGTPVDDVLPVSSRPPLRSDRDRGAILFLLDKSGSMNQKAGGTLLWNIAVSAVDKALSIPSSGHDVGIMVADDVPRLIVPPGRIYSKRAAVEKLQKTAPFGLGIYIYDALQKAVRELDEERHASWKHIILYADMSDCEQKFDTGGASVFDLLNEAREKEISVSTIGVGADDSEDRAFLEEMAVEGGGKFYSVANPEELPIVFVREASRITGSDIVDEDFTPVEAHRLHFLDETARRAISAQGYPPLRGYVRTTAKEDATVFLESGEGDPLLASWRYGHGAGGAFTSGMDERWGGKWLEWERMGLIWDHFLNHLCTDVIDSDCVALLDEYAEEMKVEMVLYSHTGRPVDRGELEVVTVRPDSVVTDHRIWPDREKRYRLRVPVTRQGNYRIIAGGGNSESTRTWCRSVSGGEIFFDSPGRTGFFEHIARQSGGIYSHDAEDIVRYFSDMKRREGFPLRRALLCGAIFFFLCQMILRKTVSQ
jgi:hypothetical protein